MNKDVYPKGIVPLEIAKKMKTLGFNQPCIFFYREKGMCVCLNTSDTNISGVADYYRLSHIKYNNNIEKYNSNQQEDYVSLPDFETAYDWFMSFDFIEGFFIKKKEEGYYEFLLYAKNKTEESYCKRCKFKGLEKTRYELFNELCNTIHYYEKVLHVDNK